MSSLTAQRALDSPARGLTSGATRRLGREWHVSTTVWLVVGDAVALSVAFALAWALRFTARLPLLDVLPPRPDFYSLLTFWAVPTWLLIFALYRLYDRHYLFAGFDEYTRVAHACTIGTIVLVLISFVDLTVVISRGWLIATWLLSIVTASLGRFAARQVLRHLRRRGHCVTPTIVVGANEEGRALAEQFAANPGSGIRVVGFVDSSLPAGAPVVGQSRVLGGLGDRPGLLRTSSADEVVVATTALSREEFLNLYRTVGREDGIELRLSSGLFEILTTGVRVREVCSVPLVTPRRVRITGADALVKTAFDYFGAACGLVLLGPLLLGIALAGRLDSTGPALHRRRVLGRGGRTFDALKFRTMVVDADEVLAKSPGLRAAFATGQKPKSDPRVTRIGRFLRRTSLDELPQLVNVLCGQMSLVGPRMISPDEAHLYGRWQLNLLTVKPGITGPWQVRGRSDIPYQERVLLSMHYIRNYTIWLDLEILLRTMSVVVKGKGAY